MCWKHLHVIMAGPNESLLTEHNRSSIISLKTENKAVSCSLISEGTVLLLECSQVLSICHRVKSCFESEVEYGALVE
jgi:hypothetical protein